MQIGAAMVCSTLGGRKQCCTRHEPLHRSTSHEHELSSTTWTRRLAVPRTPRQSPPPPPRPRPLARAFGALTARAKGFDSGKPPQRYQPQTPGTQRRALSPTTQAPKGGSQRVFPTGPRSRLRQEPGLPEPRCERPGPSETSQRRPRSPRDLNLPWHLSNSRFQRPPAGLCSEETPIAKAPNWVVSPTSGFETYRTGNGPAQSTQNLTSAKAKGPLAEKRRQTAVFSLQPLRQTPYKMAAAPSPYNPQGGL